VPINIEIAQDKVIAISPDPAAVQNHFGNTPIYGIVISPEMIRDMMMGYGEGMRMMNNMTGMGGGMMQGPSGDAGETPGALPPSEGLDAGETPGALPPSESLDAGETPMEGNMTTDSGGGI
jgi:hypothetical protein